MNRILIVDDKAENIYALEKLLEKSDRVFLSATDGNEGLRLALSNSIDLIILDVQMPDMDGFEVAQILKSNKRTKEIPIIFTSAEKKERQFVLKGFEEGAFDYLSKPLDPELTKGKVSVLLQLQMQKKELLEKNTSLEKAEGQIRELNADLQKHVRQLEITNRELESFSYSVSHDLRSPLRALQGFSVILEEDYGNKLDEEGKRLLAVIQRNVLKMDRLIEDLLALSKVGKTEIKKAKIDTARQVQGIINDMKGMAQNNVTFTVHSLLPVQADHSLLNQVWVNLISNAVKYSSKKEKPVVEIGALKNDTEIIHYVKDNGVGFDMNYADKLFGVFQRLHKATDFEGTGVGLAIVQRIITRHGGRVWAESKPGEGATFYFALPAS